MPNKRSIGKPTPPKGNQTAIIPTVVKPSVGISFSFKYFQPDHERFSYASKDMGYVQALLTRLKDLSGWKAQDMLTNRNSALRCNPINWNDTSESGFGLPQEEQLVDPPYQFQISANAHGRVHGFIVDEVFYIVWLDPDHLLYSAKK